tara:strand:+ start:1035 stop:1244 length:210 start_codon:yes stop_codon:yes gene_type:complete
LEKEEKKEMKRALNSWRENILFTKKCDCNRSSRKVTFFHSGLIIILLLIITVVAIAGCDSGWSIAGHEL